jgi:hypothetical protein
LWMQQERNTKQLNLEGSSPLQLVHYCQKRHLGLTSNLIGSPFRKVKLSSQSGPIHLFA